MERKMYADKVAKKYCKTCKNFTNCRLPCTWVLGELWDKLGGKTTIGEMQELMQKARRKMHTDEKK